MIDKNCAAPNRMESHFFWPDDSKAETATDMRIKRRNSVQASDRPMYEKQNSVQRNDVDTKKSFSKEFSQSSIQFYDNLNDNNSTTKRRSQLQSRGLKKSELAEKPTATKMELPESVVDEAYTTAKKSQAYTSKIQFYDFVNEEDNARNSRNNLRKPKMDMNDKREMELNSKNSPKLQMKHDVRSLSEEKEMPKLNNREVKTLERSSRIKEVNVGRTPVRDDYDDHEDVYNGRSHTSPKRTLAASKSNSNHSERDSYRILERNNVRDDGYRQTKRPNVSPKRNFIKPDPRYPNERDMYRKSNNSVLSRNDDDHYGESRRHSTRTVENHEDLIEYPKYKSGGNEIKRHNSRSQYDYPDNGRHFNDYEEEIGTRMKTVRIQQSPPRKQQQQYKREEEEHFNQVDESPRYSRNRSAGTEQGKRGNAQRHSNYNDSERYEADVSYVEEVKPINGGRSNFNRVNNRLNNENHTGWDDYVPAGHSAPINPSRRATSSSAALDANDNNSTKKHLRSSLCFHDGAIIAENDATPSPTTTQQSTQRRNARSSATKRVSVGLPD